jgi:hypothetical protein
MKKFLQHLLTCHLVLFFCISSVAQPPEPFDSCPGVSVAITRPGFNLTLVPHQIYVIDSNGAIQACGDPIDLQINGFGLNNEDGFLYGMHQTFNVANPFLTRVGKNGAYRKVGTILAPSVGQFKVGIINTAAGTVDDKDNYFFTAVVINLQNILLPPDLYVGKIEKISRLQEGSSPLQVSYKKLNPGTCLDELLMAFANPLNGMFQDIAYNPANGNIYTFLPGAGTAPTPGKIVRFNPSSNSPSLICIDPPAPNTPTMDLSGLFFGKDTALYILTIDGNYYKGDVATGEISLITQTALPLLSNNLRGDMASCVGKKKLKPFVGCPGLSLAITRPGINSGTDPYQVYQINANNGNIRPMGHPINLQINGFGLNRKDGFLYGMHESSDIFGPSFARVDSNGDYIDLGILTPPDGSGNQVGIINTAAATMDGSDNYYFTAIVADTQLSLHVPGLYLGIIKNVSQLEQGDNINIQYKKIFLGTCVDEILLSLLNPGNGLFQDIAFNPKDGRIYTYIQPGPSPIRGKLAWFDPDRPFINLHCLNGHPSNQPTQDLSGMFANDDDRLFILTIDGKFYRANPHNGMITLVNQTTLPRFANNLRGDMASCVKKNEHGHGHDDDDDGRYGDDIYTSVDQYLRVAPNPVSGSEMLVLVNSDEQATVEVRILDMNGKMMQQMPKASLIRGENQFKLQVRDLQRGMFTLLLQYPSGKRQVVKFVRM